MAEPLLDIIKYTIIILNSYSSELTQKLELAKDVTEEVAQLIQALYFSNASFDLEKRGWFDKVGFHYLKQSNSLTKFVYGSKGIRQ